jgi:hypothetical protein
MYEVMNGRQLLGTLKPVSTGGFECFDADGAYVGKISRVGEAAALLRANKSPRGDKPAAPKLGASSAQHAPRARAGSRA